MYQFHTKLLDFFKHFLDQNIPVLITTIWSLHISYTSICIIV